MNSSAAQNASMPETCEVLIASRPEWAAWDAYVASHENGGVCHLSGWARAISETYGYDCFVFLAKRAGSIVGGVPVVHIRSALTGDALISMGFTVGGGLLADDDEVANSLANVLGTFGRTKKVDYVELRSDHSSLGNWVLKDQKYVSFHTKIQSADAEQLQIIPRKRRAEIRKGIKQIANAELNIRVSSDLDEFYELFAEAMKAHGTPVFPNMFVRNLQLAFGKMLEFSILEERGRPIGGLASFFFKDTVSPYYFGGGRDVRRVRAHELLIWSLIGRAREKGFSRFDFGRSKIGSGSHRFKQLWGMEEERVCYRYKLFNGATTPDINPTNPKYALAVSMWKYLPKSVANSLGPTLARHFP